jgi:hypothetical protein
LLESVTPCEILVVSQCELFGIFNGADPDAQVVVAGYAQGVVDYIVREAPSYLSDLPATIDFDSVVALMPQDARVLMSYPAMDILRKGKFPAKKMQALEEEVNNGKCNLAQNKLGKVERVVKLVLLQLKRADGLMLVKLGTGTQGSSTDVPTDFAPKSSNTSDDDTVVKVELPGKKMKMYETTTDCVSRALEERFSKFSPAITVTGHTFYEESSQSYEYGISTKYLKTFVQAALDAKKQMWTHTCAWDDVQVDCLGTFEADSQTVHVFAWLSQQQFEVLCALGPEEHSMVSQWIHESKTFISL